MIMFCTIDIIGHYTRVIFFQGLDKTKNQHFAGGNTYWEEKKLGKFITSETRLLEAMEYVCKKKYVQNWDKYKDIKNLEFKCMQLVEESEDNIENWYFHKQSSDPDILLWLCHGKLRLCCSEGHYGAECSPCPGVKQNVSVCSDHGSCQGDGSREGTGKCVCHKGYVGFMCSNCDANYYAVPNISVFTCNECHQSCKGGCFNSGPENCKECHTGWIMSDNHKCEDINECESENRCSGKHMKCHNLEGSYECVCEEGFVIDSKGNCKINVEASAEEMWIPPSRLLRSFSISSFCILISLVIWRRSLSLSIFATICALIILLIEFYFDHSSFFELSHYLL
ncbi:unnamed protein product [Thelazia callipaeda]|uniref:protein disulfide-isomerase n=1 Tax=Thelazia callipaeda TaxID=103827 RepID=A0A0N5CNE2_THECL|nr:unnamed protein product [Thelazia callipaeda]